MKKFYFTILSTIFCAGAMVAQSLTQTNHAPAVGNMYTTKQCDSTGITGGANGAGQLWNYSTIIVHPTPTNYTVVSATSTGSTAYASANVAMSAGPSKNSFYSSSSSMYQYWGGDLSIGGLAITLTYTNAATYATYPFAFGSSANSTVSGTLTSPAGNGSFSGSASVSGAGTGTIMLPAGTVNNILKTVTTQSLNYTFPLGSGSITENRSDFYAPTISKFPLLTVSSSVLTSTVFGTPQSSSQTIVTIDGAYALGLKESLGLNADFSVFPNPAQENITISYLNLFSEKASYEVVNAIGQVVMKDVFSASAGEVKNNITIAALESGIYFVKLTVGNSTSVKKITVQ
jgi:hypothetical protein